MATKQVQSFSQYEKKKDFLDAVYLLDPSDTPFLSMVKKTRAKNNLVGWTEDELEVHDGSGIVEGSDTIGTADFNPATALQNYCQIMVSVAKVSNTSKAVDWYGRNDEMAMQVSKKIKSLKIAFEKSCTAVDVGSTAPGSSQAAVSASFLNQISADTTTEAAALDEAAIQTAHQAVWDAGGNPSALITTGADSVGIAGIAVSGQGRLRDSLQTKKLVGAIDIVVTPFGSLSLIPSRYMQDDTLLFVDPMYAEATFLREFDVTDLSSSGDYEAKQVAVEGCSKALNTKAHGLLNITGGGAFSAETKKRSKKE